MSMVIKFNARQLEASIHNIAERAARDASASMRKTAVRIRDLARSYAPIDTGLLEKSIQYGTIKDPATRRNVFVVFLDVDASRYSGSGQLGDYAWIMEEELHPFGRKKGKLFYNLGEKSRTKAATGRKVGGRFLSRAVKEGTAQMVAEATASVSRVLRNGRWINMRYERDTGDEE